MNETRAERTLDLEELPVLERPTVPAFRESFVERSLPVRIRGALAGSTALARWSPEDLAARFGDVEIDTYAMERGRIKLDPKTGFQLVRLPIREYVSHVLGGDEPRYYLRARLPGTLPRLADEIDTPVYCAGGRRLRKNLWFSAPGTITSLHFDLPHNLVAQIHGKKRFILFPSRERLNLYPHPWISSSPHLAQINPENPDFMRYPRLARARGYSCTLEPGDLLFMPSRTWHHARSLTSSISVNFWWTEGPIIALVELSDLYKRLRGLNI
jgi:hypothetical protein